jgi:transaldolase
MAIELTDIDHVGIAVEDLEAAGIDYDDVVAVLEKEGVEKFAKSFKELFADVESKRDRLVAA